jgi:hypothetical protein
VLVLLIGSVGIGSKAYFSDSEVTTTNALITGNWESLSIVGANGDGQWKSPHWVVTMYPNEQKATAVTFANSSADDTVVTLTATPVSHDGGNLIFGFNTPTFSVPGKGQATVVFWVQTNQSVTPGIYTTIVTVER